jgi:hypothetical protein
MERRCFDVLGSGNLPETCRQTGGPLFTRTKTA